MDPRVLIFAGVIVLGIGQLVAGAATRAAASYARGRGVRTTGRIAIVRQYRELRSAKGLSTGAATAFALGLIASAAGLTAIGTGIALLDR